MHRCERPYGRWASAAGCHPVKESEDGLLKRPSGRASQTTFRRVAHVMRLSRVARSHTSTAHVGARWFLWGRMGGAFLGEDASLAPVRDCHLGRAQLFFKAFVACGRCRTCDSSPRPRLVDAPISRMQVVKLSLLPCRVSGGRRPTGRFQRPRTGFGPAACQSPATVTARRIACAVGVCSGTMDETRVDRSSLSFGRIATVHRLGAHSQVRPLRQNANRTRRWFSSMRART